MFLFGYQFISNIQFSYYSTSDTFSTLDGLVCFPFVFEGFLKKSMLSSGKKSKIAFLVSQVCTYLETFQTINADSLSSLYGNSNKKFNYGNNYKPTNYSHPQISSLLQLKFFVVSIEKLRYF